jgi:hypothetical protein
VWSLKHASVSGGHADSFFGVREFQEDFLAKYSLVALICVRVFSQSVKRSLGRNINFIVN